LEQFTIIDAPSILGLRPTGVEHLPEALKAAGLMSELRAEYGGQVSPLSYNSERDKLTLLLNPDSIRAFSLQLADAVAFVLHKKTVPSGTRWRLQHPYRKPSGLTPFGNIWTILHRRSC
jgi:arginase